MADSQDQDQGQGQWVTQIPPATAQPTAAPTGDAGDWVTTQKNIPAWSSGINPQSAINDSPLSIMDKMKISVGKVGGNEEGETQYLNSKGYQTARDPKTGELTIKDPKDGAWKYAHEQDPWRLSALVNDVAENVAPITAAAIHGMVSGALVAASPLTGGASLAAEGAVNAATAAAIAKARTSMGKALGTYPEGDVKSELKDITTESVLGLGAWGLQKGMAPLLGRIGAGVSKLGDHMEEAGVKAAASTVPGVETQATPTQNLLKRVVSLGYGESEDHVAPIIMRPKEIAAIAARDELSGASPEFVKDTMKRESIDHMNDVARAVTGKGGVKDAAITAFKEPLIKATPPGFAYSHDASYSAAIKQLYSEGLIDVTHAGASAGAKDIGADLLAKGETNLAKYAVKLRDDAALRNAGRVDFAASDEARGAVQQMINNLRAGIGQGTKMGKEAMDTLVQTRTGLKNTAEKLAGDLYDSRLGFAAKTINGAMGAVDETLKGAADKATSGAMSNYLSQTSKVLETLAPITDAMRTAARSGTKDSFDALLGKYLAPGGQSVLDKNAVNQVIQIANKYAPEAARAVAGHLQSIMDKNAVSIMADRIVPKIGRAQNLYGMAKTAMGSITQGATEAVVKGGAAIPQTVIDTGRMVKGTIGAMSKPVLVQLLKNPGALQQVLMAPYAAHQQYQQAGQQLMSKVEQVQQGSQQYQQAASQSVQQAAEPPPGAPR